MNDFKRLIDSAENPKVRKLLREGLGDAPNPRALSRAAAALGLGAMTSLGNAAAGTAASSTLLAASTVELTGAAAPGAIAGGKAIALLAGKWLLVGLFGGGAISGGALAVQRASDSTGTTARTVPLASARRPFSVSERAAARGALHAVAPNATVGSVRAPPGADDRASAAHSRALASPSAAIPKRALAAAVPAAATSAETAAPSEPSEPLARAAAPAAAAPASGALGAEVARIDAARGALAAGDIARALAELDAYERSFKLGVLEREARLLRIEALQRRGESSKARELAADYVRRFPSDAHSRRLSRDLGLRAAPE